MLGTFELGTTELGTSGEEAEEASSIYVHGQAQAYILAAFNASAQSQADIKATSNAYGQSQARIKHTYQGYAQAQAYIYIVNRGYGQAQGEIIFSGAVVRKYGQVRAYIRVVTRAYGQALGTITTTRPTGMAQAYIVRPAAFGQAQALINDRKPHAQAMAQIKDTTNKVHAQARALIVNKKKHGQAQAKIIAFNIRGYGQALANISKSQGKGQAAALIAQAHPRMFAQARSYINSSPTQFAETQAQILIISQGYGQSQAHIKAKVQAFAQAQAKLLSFGYSQYGQASAYIDNGSPFIEDLLVDAHTYAFSNGYSTTGFVDMTTYGNDPEDADPNYSGPTPADGTWADEYDDSSPFNAAPNGWFYFTLSSTVNVHFDTFEFNDFEHDTVLGIYTGTSTSGAWNVLAGSDDAGGGFESEIDVLLSAGTYLAQVGFYGYVVTNAVAPLTIYLHINVYSPVGVGQAQAVISQPQPRQYGQVQALISKTIALGQAQAKIKHFGATSYGQAGARVYLATGQNESNSYQRVVMLDEPTAYYTFGESFLPGAGDVNSPYEQSNAVYKDTAWDNVGLYDLLRQFGGISYGPYGGPTVGTYAYTSTYHSATPLHLPSFAAYFAEPLGIPGTESQTGILSQDEDHFGFNYLLRYGDTSPITGHEYWTIEFWYKPLDLPINGYDSIIRVGNKEFGDIGAVEIGYNNVGQIVVYFGRGGGSADSGPIYTGLIANQWYHVVLTNTNDFDDFPHMTRLWINGVQVDNTTQILDDMVDTVFIHSNQVAGNVFLLDQVALYDYEIFYNTFTGESSILDHYNAGIKFSGGLGQAQAFILTGTRAYGQALADIFNPWAKGQAQAYIVNHNRKYAQAQAYIKGYMTGQAQAFILAGKRGFGQARAKISSPVIKTGQAQAKITNKTPTGQAQAIIKNEHYFVSYNGYKLPGYAQEESIESVAKIQSFSVPFRDVGFSEYIGLENKNLSLRMLVVGENYLDCKNEIEMAGTLVRTKRAGFAPLYVGYYDRYFEALTKSISTDGNTGNIRTAEYNLEFECRPWLVSPVENTLTGTTLVQTTGRTFDNGGWTPTTIRVTGTNVTISGYTDTGEFAGYISISGTVTDMIINTEDYETTINGQNANRFMLNTDYQMHVGPGVTNYAIIGATDCNITYKDRWYL